jgi:DNA adenine methylase
MVKNPFLKYHGGKWLLAPKIVSLFPPHRSYVEPFGGGGAVLLYKERSHTEVYNDLDEDIVNLFYVARERGEELSEKLKYTPYARQELELAFHKSDDPLEKARRLLIRGMFGRSPSAVNIETGASAFRARQPGARKIMANVWMDFPKRVNAICDRLRGVIIENKDAFELIGQFDSEDTLFYVDPPYMSKTRDAGTDYKYELTNAEHEKLAVLLKSVKGKVILSGYDSEEYETWYAGWRRKEFELYADGSIQRGGKRIKRVEVIWMNFENFSMF